ncbi:MAG: DUF2493 domain-containing protein [Alkalilacustris sp.]
MRLLLAGGRHLDDVGMIRRALDRAHALGPAEVLIHGGAGVLGVAAEDWARERRLHVIRYPANWREFGKRAEGLRDAFMLDDSRPDLVLALPGGGDTRALVLRALAAGLRVIDAEGQPVPASAPDEPERWRGPTLQIVPTA